MKTTTYEVTSTDKHAFDLAHYCLRVIEQNKLRPMITVSYPKGWKPPKGFPRRTILSVNSEGETNYSVRADKCLEWLVANQLVTYDKVKEVEH